VNIIIDTNIVFSYFKKNSFTHNIIKNFSGKIFAPKALFQELRKYEQTIQEKNKISPKEYVLLEKELYSILTVVETKELAPFLEQAKEICPDSDDVQFFAVALAKEGMLWSNDKRLKEQLVVAVIATHELTNYF